MEYIDFEEIILEKIFESKESVETNKVLKTLQEKIEMQLKEREKAEGNIDDFRKILNLMEVRNEILLIKIYLDGLNDFNDLEKVFNNEDLRSHIRNFNLVEIYNEIYNDDCKGELIDD